MQKILLVIIVFHIQTLCSEFDIYFMEENDFPAYGEIWVNLNSTGSDSIISYDTLNFDNVFIIESIRIIDPTLGCGSNNFYAIVLKNHDNPIWGENVNLMGYLFSDSLKSLPIMYQDILFTSGNGDTIWENGEQFPDSLSPLDSIYDWGSEYHGIGKYFAEDHYDYCENFGDYSGLENFNSIIYLKLTNSYIIKIQLIEVVGSNTPPPSIVHRVRLRYQIEDASDNTFTTNVINRKISIGATGSRYYDIKGRKIGKSLFKLPNWRYYSDD